MIKEIALHYTVYNKLMQCKKHITYPKCFIKKRDNQGLMM